MVLYSLADRFGMTVADLKARMTEEEYIGWCAYLRIRREQTNG
jgi:hypothetical protein